MNASKLFLRIPLLSLIFSPTLFLLMSCATTANYENILESWVGHPESELVSSWGIPDGSYETGEKKYLIYNYSKSSYIPGTKPSYRTNIIGNTAYTTSSGGSPGFMVNKRCKTTFTITNGTIVNWDWMGNACRA